MSEFTRGVLTALIPFLIINIIAIIITAKVTMWQFYKKKWWDKKAEAYSQILEILAELASRIVEASLYAKGELSLDDEDEIKFSESLDKIRNSIGKVFIISAYTIPNYAFKTLRKLRDTLAELKTEDEDDVIGSLNKIEELIFDCIKEIKNCEKKDLKIK